MVAQGSEREVESRDGSELETPPACVITVDVIPGRFDPDEGPEEPDADAFDNDGEEGEEEYAGLPVVDAGAEMTLIGTIEWLPPRDLRHLSLLFKDEEGSLQGEAGIVDFDGEINCATDLALRAPVEPGEHTWSAVLPAHTVDDIGYPEISVPFRFMVKAHTTSVLVWDVPTAIVAGETFQFRLGVKCSSACGPAGWTFAVSNENGEAIAAGTLGDEPWKGTGALYYAEVEARAPIKEGLEHWTVTAPGPNVEIPHEQHTIRFGVRSVRSPECLITVEAIDKATGEPIKGARVVIHPYRAFTNADGHAEVRVPKGIYTIMVSGPRHVPYRSEGQVAADTSIRAELIINRGPTEAELWA